MFQWDAIFVIVVVVFCFVLLFVCLFVCFCFFWGGAFLYHRSVWCETWTLLADSDKRFQALGPGVIPCGRLSSKHQLTNQPTNQPTFQTKCMKRLYRHLLIGAREQDQIPHGSTRISSGNCQEIDSFKVRACHMPQQPLLNHPPGHLRGWATPLSAEQVLGR